MAADSIAARMMADLGVGRRDVVTAPDQDDKKNRNAQGIAARARENDEVQRVVQAHRARVAKATAPAPNDNEQTARIKKWSNQTVFDRDEVAEKLENRYDGQGHRAAMKRRMGYGENAEAKNSEVVENTFGEERGLYLRERGVNPVGAARAAPNQNNQQQRREMPRPTNVPSAQDRTPRATNVSTAQDRFFQHVLGGERSSREPRASNAVSSPNTPNRGRDRRVANSTPNRAPSPKGRTRYVRDQVVRQQGVSQQGVSQQANDQVGAQAQPQRITRQQDITAPPHAHPPMLATPSKVVSIRAPSPSAESNTTTSTRTRRSRGSRKGGFNDLDDSNRFKGLRGLKTTTPNTRPALVNPMADEVYGLRALWYAANPGMDSDVYHEKFPDRKPLLEWALKKLFLEVVLLLKEADERDIKHYLETHQERQWMIDDAKKAKDLIENSTEDEVEAYCQAHPAQKDFINFAASHFTPSIRRDSVIPGEIPVEIPGLTNAATVAANSSTPAINDVPDDVVKPAVEKEIFKIRGRAATPTSNGRLAVKGSSAQGLSSPLLVPEVRDVGAAVRTLVPEKKTTEAMSPAATPVPAPTARPVRNAIVHQSSSSPPLPQGTKGVRERVVAPAPEKKPVETQSHASTPKPPPHSRIAMTGKSDQSSASPPPAPEIKDVRDSVVMPVADEKTIDTEDLSSTPLPTSNSKLAVNYQSDQSSSSPLPAQNGGIHRVHVARKVHNVHKAHRVKVTGVHTSDSEDEAKDSSTTSVEMEVAVTKPEMQGHLTATFYDINGMFIGIDQSKVQAPVMATMNIASRSPTYNPRELIVAIKRLAESMVEKTNGNASAANLVSYESDEEEL